VRREREIRNQQLLEVSLDDYHRVVSFTFVSISLFHSHKELFSYSIWDTYVFLYFCPPVVRVACSLCVPYLYIHTYIYIISVYIYICLYIYIHIIRSFLMNILV